MKEMWAHLIRFDPGWEPYIKKLRKAQRLSEYRIITDQMSRNEMEERKKGGICRLRYEKVSSCMVKGFINLTSITIQDKCGQSLFIR